MYQKNKATGEIAFFNCLQPGWVEATEEEADVYKLNEAKDKKVTELKSSLSDYLNSGFVYKDNQFKLTEDVLNNLQRKNDLSDSDPTKFIFCNKEHIEVDFQTAEDFSIFRTALNEEQNRVMIKYNNYRSQIAVIVISDQMTYLQCLTALQNIIIDFSS